MPTRLEELMRLHGWGQRVKGPVLRTRVDDPPKQCIDPEGQDRLCLVRHAAGDLSAAEQQHVAQHVATCACCEEYLNRVAPQVARNFLRQLAIGERAGRKRPRKKKRGS